MRSVRNDIIDLGKFDTITLDEMKDIRLMNRIDTKFVTTIPVLCKLLEMAKEEYRIQETCGKRLLEYYTLYFDTPAHDMYISHQNGKKRRQKIRVRSYVDSNLSFLEVKNKFANGRTKKKRISISDKSQWNSPDSLDFLAERSRYDVSIIRPQIENSFCRITLVNRALSERITIDVNLRFHNIENDIRLEMTDCVIIELKRDGNKTSQINKMLQNLRVKPSRFSKYCVGCAKTDPGLKQNRFKPLFTYLNKLLQ